MKERKQEFVFYENKKFTPEEYRIYRAKEKLKLAKELSGTKYLEEALFVIYLAVFTAVRAILYKRDIVPNERDIIEVFDKYNFLRDISSDIESTIKDIAELKDKLERDEVIKLEQAKVSDLVERAERIVLDIEREVMKK